MTAKDNQRIAGDYCEHQSLGKSCAACVEVVADVMHAVFTSGFRLMEYRRVPGKAERSDAGGKS